jgi:hypothetical protein
VGADKLASQPLAALPSQLAYPGLQAPRPHAPLVQTGEPFCAVHTVPQAPQCEGLVRLVSQPFARLPSQSLNPALHADWHAPVAHEAVALAPAEQVTPHPPQLARVFVAVSQPFAATPSQSAVPAPHWRLQLPAVSQPFAALPSQSPKPASHA